MTTFAENCEKKYVINITHQEIQRFLNVVENEDISSLMWLENRMREAKECT